MSEQVIKLSDNAANRIKEIMSKADNTAIGVRVGVKSGGCAGSGNTPPIAASSGGPQGNNGGGSIQGAGGGGFGEAGCTDGEKAGGDGLALTISGTPYTLAGGGGGGGPTSCSGTSPGGDGGGGNGSLTAEGSAGTTNTGGGGGGGNSTPYINGKSGASGTVILAENFICGVQAPGMWTLNEVYDNVKADNWTN